MVLEISTNARRAASEAVKTFTLLDIVLTQAVPIILRDTDEAITEHIQEQFKGRSWKPLTGATMNLRAKRRAPGRSRQPLRSLWYVRQAPKIRSPDSPRSFGWTGTAQAAAEAPGKITGTKNPTLVREFKSKGARARDRLVFGHLGTRQVVTRKQRRFLSSVGFHLANSTTTLRRPPRPIYKDAEIERIATTRFEERVGDFLDAINEGSPGFFSTTVVS